MLKRILLMIAAILAALLVLSAFNLFPFDQPALSAPPEAARAEAPAVIPPADPATMPAQADDTGQNQAEVILPAPTAIPPTPLPEPAAASAQLLNGWKVFIPQVTKQEAMFLVQPGTPAYVPNFAHPAQGCNWLSVAGQVLESTGSTPLGGPNGQPVSGLVVSVLGNLEGSAVDQLTLTGLAPDYGPGGYEVQLSGRPVASSQALWVQVFNLDGQAVTGPVFFDTRADCSQNVVLVNFKR